MSETKVKLTDDQLKKVLTDYIAGKNTSQIVDDLFLEMSLDDTAANRQMVREQLRSANPHDTRFAWTKYGAMYELVRQSVVEAFRHQTREAVRSVLGTLVDGMEDIDLIGENLINILENASDRDITSNSEYLNTVRTFASLQKLRIEGVNAIANLADQLCKLPVPPDLVQPN